MVLQEEDLTPDRLLSSILELFQNRQSYIAAMDKSSASDAVNTIISLIEEITNK